MGEDDLDYGNQSESRSREFGQVNFNVSPHATSTIELEKSFARSQNDFEPLSSRFPRKRIYR
ncbi:MAG: hypothetical protein SVX43_16585 [Cyanobacteriota bacterium]|nr:hypothetical protein [Cyanobacteriota bacterium]